MHCYLHTFIIRFLHPHVQTYNKLKSYATKLYSLPLSRVYGRKLQPKLKIEFKFTLNSNSSLPLGKLNLNSRISSFLEGDLMLCSSIKLFCTILNQSMRGVLSVQNKNSKTWNWKMPLEDTWKDPHQGRHLPVPNVTRHLHKRIIWGDMNGFTEAKSNLSVPKVTRHLHERMIWGDMKGLIQVRSHLPASIVARHLH